MKLNRTFQARNDAKKIGGVQSQKCDVNVVSPFRGDYVRSCADTTQNKLRSIPTLIAGMAHGL
jgi:hypothetical protein